MVGDVPIGGARAVARCDELGIAPYSDLPDQLFRAWLTPAFAATQARIAKWMAEAGMTVTIDAATNLTGRYEGTTAGAPALMIASHIDSVRDAGRYDGPLGVMLGIECVAALHAAGHRLPFAIEVVAFGDEEGSRFPTAMLTSRAVAGTLDAAALAVVDAAGLTMAEALATYHRPIPSCHPGGGRGPVGGRLQSDHDGHPDWAPASAGVIEGGDALLAAARPSGAILAYLEPHIEQGPALEAERLALGAVTGIAAQARYRIDLTGTAGHAGTTAMPLRRDALVAAAEAILAVERIGAAGPADLVATVGRLDAAPGVANVIPGHVAFTLDVRALDESVRDAAADAILTEVAAIAARRGIAVTQARTHHLPASPCDPRLTDLLAAAMAATGHPDRRLASGAGHDAMVMAALCPTAMLFIRCTGGISHNPAEHVRADDADAAFRTMLAFIDLLGDEFDPAA